MLLADSARRPAVPVISSFETRWAGAAIALGLLANAPLLAASLGATAWIPTESWFFAPEQQSPLLAIGLSGWLLWRRRARLRGPEARGNPLLATAMLLAAAALYVWAQYAGAVDLMLASMAIQVLALGAAQVGLRGCRNVLLPAAVLLIALPLPGPLYNEVVWHLQRAAATGAASCLELLGFEVDKSDVLLVVGERSFMVVEACSGLRGIEILTLVAIAIRELLGKAGAWSWVVVLAAPPLAFVMNIVRVASISLFTDDPGVRISVAEGHLKQGLLVLIVGTVVLYGIGLGIARATRARPTRPLGVDADPRARSASLLPRITIFFALLVVLLLVTPRSEPHQASALEGTAPVDLAREAGVVLPESRRGWQSVDIEPDRLLLGQLPLAEPLTRRYTRTSKGGATEVIELFVARIEPGPHRLSPFSSKLALPGREWSLVERSRVELWSLAVEADLVLARSASALALSYVWHVHDEGFFEESLRSLLALDAASDDEDRGAAIVRISAPVLRDGPVARDRAKRALDRFIGDFSDPLADL